MGNTYYTSLTGMMAASYGLQNASNNVANMKSTGFKRTDVFYSSLGNGNGHNALGSGVYVGGQYTNFSQGTHQQTGSPSDLAIVGNGFFVVQLQNGELLYTRDGEFVFNNDGYLIDNHSKGLVQGYDQQGNLVPICQFGPKVYPGKATHSIDLHGEFIISELDSDNSDSLYQKNSFSLTIYDEKGIAHTLTMDFQAPKSMPPIPNRVDELCWQLVGVTLDNDNSGIEFSGQELQFDSNTNGRQAPTIGNNTINITLKNKQEITLNFGDAMTNEDSTVCIYKKNEIDHPKTTIEVKKQDGYHFGRQVEFEFDDNGQISYIYDNEKSLKGNFVALALFDELEHTLVQAQDNLYRAKNTDGLRIGRPNKESFGTLKPKYLESSNVDPTNEFANIVVLQRMFQSCSQIMDIEKQLLEEMYKK